MSALDRLHQAEAAARKAYRHLLLEPTLAKAVDFAEAALRDLLAALDAARGEAVATVQTITSLAGETRKVIIGKADVIDALPVGTAVYAAPPAALADAFAIAHTAAKMTADACKSATGRHGTINKFVNLVQIAHDAAALAQQPAAAVPEGYALVPVEPTEAMLDVMHDRVRILCNPAEKSASIRNDREVWAAMLAAAERKGGES